MRKLQFRVEIDGTGHHRGDGKGTLAERAFCSKKSGHARAARRSTGARGGGGAEVGRGARREMAGVEGAGHRNNRCYNTGIHEIKIILT